MSMSMYVHVHVHVQVHAYACAYACTASVAHYTVHIFKGTPGKWGGLHILCDDPHRLSEPGMRASAPWDNRVGTLGK